MDARFKRVSAKEGVCSKQNYLTNLSLPNRKSRESLNGGDGPDGY